MALNIKRPRKSVPFYEDRAAGMQVTAAETALDEAKQKYADRLASKAVKDAEKAVDEAKAAAMATVLDLTLEALPKKRWAEAQAAHPPRTGDALDKNYNLNIDTFLAEVLGESVVEVRQRGTGELRTDVTSADWTEAAGEIDDGQWSVLFLTVVNLNRYHTDPF